MFLAVDIRLPGDWAYSIGVAVNHINGLLWAFSGPCDDEGVGERTPRRDRLREQLSHDIKRSARRLLVEQGPSTLTLSAIARDVEVTAPALYRYYAGLHDIVRSLAADLVTELVEEMRSAVERRPPHDLAGRLRAATYAFREWSVSHVVEFGLLFGAPSPEAGPAQAELAKDWMVRLGGVWGFPQAGGHGRGSSADLPRGRHR